MNQPHDSRHKPELDANHNNSIAQNITDNNPSTTLRDWTLTAWDTMRELLDCGYSPIPLAARSKVPPKGFPLGEYLHGERAVSLDAITAWERDYPDATNVGILCGPRFGVLVTDCDTSAALAAFESLSSDLEPPPTPRATTARGQHDYWQCPPDIHETVIGVLPGLDVKASGYVVAPPSVHPDGSTYTALVPLDTPRAAAPEWLLRLVRDRQRATTPAPTSISVVNTSLPDASDHATAHLWDAIEAALGMPPGLAASREWVDGLDCPMHPDGTKSHSASWSRMHGGMLKCHAGCTPGVMNTSNGKRTYGAVDTARKLGVLQPAPKSTHAPLRGLSRASANASLAKVVVEGQKLKEPDGRIKVQNVPPKTILLTRAQILNFNAKRPSRTCTVPSLDAVREQYAGGVEVVIPAKKLASLADLRGFVYATFDAGVYSRAQLAEPLGVSSSATRAYDKRASVTVQKRYKRIPLTDCDEDAAHFTEAREDYGPNTWIEDLDENKYPPTVRGFREALAAGLLRHGKATATLCHQQSNHYTPPQRDPTTRGIPLEWLREGIRNGHEDALTVMIALWYAGVKGGRRLTAKRAMSIVESLGIPKSRVKRVWSKVWSGEYEHAIERKPSKPRTTTKRKSEGSAAVSTFTAYTEPREPEEPPHETTSNSVSNSPPHAAESPPPAPDETPPAAVECPKMSDILSLEPPTPPSEPPHEKTAELFPTPPPPTPGETPAPQAQLALEPGVKVCLACGKPTAERSFVGLCPECDTAYHEKRVARAKRGSAA